MNCFVFKFNISEPGYLLYVEQKQTGTWTCLSSAVHHFNSSGSSHISRDHIDRELTASHVIKFHQIVQANCKSEFVEERPHDQTNF